MAGVGVVGGVCDRCSCLSPPKKGCANARHGQARVKHAPCPRTIGPMNKTHQQSRIIFKAQQPDLSEYFGRQLLRPAKPLERPSSVPENALAKALNLSRVWKPVLRLAGSRRLMVVRAFSHAHTIQTQGLAGAGAGWLCGIVMTIGCGEDCAAGAASLATWAAPWKDATVIC